MTRSIRLTRGDVLARYARAWIHRIEDLTPFVTEQHARLQREGLAGLVTPVERVYPCLASSRIEAERARVSPS